MARKKKRKTENRASQAPASRELKTATAPAASVSGEPAQRTSGRRELRPYVYAVFDLGLAVLWAVLLTTQLQSRHGWASALLWSMVLLAVGMAASMFVRNKWGWRAASVCCGGLLVLWVFVLVSLLMSAAFLSGVYGSFGRAAAMGALAIAALSVELVALVPAFQLKFLMTRAGRRYFHLEPLG